MNDEEHVASLQHTVNLIMMEGNKFIDNKIREYVRSQGYVIEEGREGVQKFNAYLGSIGKKLKIELSDLNMNEDKKGIIQAVQELKIRIVPNLGGN